jgi:hypothetical protein
VVGFGDSAWSQRRWSPAAGIEPAPGDAGWKAGAPHQRRLRLVLRQLVAGARRLRADAAHSTSRNRALSARAARWVKTSSASSAATFSANAVLMNWFRLTPSRAAARRAAARMLAGASASPCARCRVAHRPGWRRSRPTPCCPLVSAVLLPGVFLFKQALKAQRKATSAGDAAALPELSAACRDASKNSHNQPTLRWEDAAGRRSMGLASAASLPRTPARACRICAAHAGPGTRSRVESRHLPPTPSFCTLEPYPR